MMQEGSLEDWRRAGTIAAQALEYGRSLIQPGARAEDVLDKIEAKIHELGGSIAFPAQVSSNATAAHWCANPQDDFVFSTELVCLDVGVHVNGCIGDNACTVDLSGQYGPLVEASRAALQAAIKQCQPGVTLSAIGRAIEQTMAEYGFRPIRNLSGHGLDLYNVHAKPSVPNFDTQDDTALEDGKIVAIEPFATDGAGLIGEAGEGNVYMQQSRKPVRSPYARKALQIIEGYNGLPFTTRWLTQRMPRAHVQLALKQLSQLGIIRKYPPLVERRKGMVSQAEHTVRVASEPEILTTP